MVDITRSRSMNGLGLAYNAFLYASVRDGADGAPLSTVSALARLDIDPWQEAAELAGLPRDSATERLAGLLARLPGGRSGLPELETTAKRLVGLLPGRASAASVGPERTSSPAAAYNVSYVLIGLGMALIMLLAGLVEAPTDGARGASSISANAASGAPAPAAPQPRRDR